jgi:hypothetical protein
VEPKPASGAPRWRADRERRDGTILEPTLLLTAVSTFVQGALTWAFPLIVFLAVVSWYVILIRRNHPD